MAAKADIRSKRIEKEYQSVREGQDDILGRIDTYEAALLGLTEAVSENTRQIAALHEKVDAMMKHMEVPFKPQAGFIKK